MTARNAARPLAGLVAVAMLLAACGGGAATTAPGTNAPATQAPVTQAPAATDNGEPTFVLPSFHADQNLEDLFPDSIGGTAMLLSSISGEDFMSFGAAPELEAMLTAVDKSPSDMSVAFGSAGIVTIIGFKVSGIPGTTIFTALFAAYDQASGATITDVSISGKAVKKVVPTDDSGTRYIYAAQDVVFSVGGEGITDALLQEAFSKLP
jgi:hypothetical protein